MGVFTFYIFNRFGDCIYYKNWGRESQEVAGESKLVAGLIYSLTIIMRQLSKSGEGGYSTMCTPQYKLHYFETCTGYRMALTSSTNISSQVGQRLLEDIFKNIFVEYVVKDFRYRHAEGVCVSSPQFSAELSAFLDKQML